MENDKSKLKLYVPEVGREVTLTVKFPKDVDPKKVKLLIPYEDGILVTEKTVIDLIKKYGNPDIDIPDIDTSNLVTINGDERIIGDKTFEGFVKVQDPEEELDAVNKRTLDITIENLNTNLIEDLTKLIGNIGDINLEEDEKLNIVTAINTIIEKIKEGNQEEIDIFYTNPNKVPNTLGGVLAGTTFNKMKLQDVITMILYPYQEPAITSFTTPKNTFEIGEDTGNSLKLVWTTSNQQNIKENGIIFYLDGKPLPGDNWPKSGNHTWEITPLKLTQQGNKTVWMDMFDIKGKKFGKGITLTWINCIYYGCSTETTMTEDIAKSFSKVNGNSLPRKYDFGEGGYKWIIYPASWGETDGTKFINPANNFVVPMDKQNNITITNSHGVSQEYLVYKSTNILNGSISITVKS